jgi:hypothetical protein
MLPKVSHNPKGAGKYAPNCGENGYYRIAYPQTR